MAKAVAKKIVVTHPRTGTEQKFDAAVYEPVKAAILQSLKGSKGKTFTELTDDVVKIISEAGEVEAAVYVYPAIHPGVIAMPFGQGHTAYGRFATSQDANGNVGRRGANPADIFGLHFNAAGDLAFAGMKVRVQPTGRKQPLSRLESRIGVYGEGMGEAH